MNQVLVVDDEAAMRTALEASFRLDGWQVSTAAGTREALDKFRSTPCSLVVTDMRMPDGDGLQVMQGVREMNLKTAVVLLTAFGSIPEAVITMKGGACDYLVKPISFERLREAAQQVLRKADEQEPDPSKDGLIGQSSVFRRMMERARQVAGSDADVLIEAESGTGKELLARLIHHSSPRCKARFVAVNCAAFPEALLESELFGHMRGAFTGATTSKPGKFELADGGTLLLDEIGELPLNLQPKLLRVLQEREVDRLGDTCPVHVDVRVIATTNRSLRGLVQEGKFRTDLFYRLNVVPLSIPPLRERREDIAQLAGHFIQKYKSKSCDSTVRISSELLVRLNQHDWQGNIRELENFIRRALALSNGSILGVDLWGEQDWMQTAAARDGLPTGISLREMEQRFWKEPSNPTREIAPGRRKCSG